VWVLRPGVVCVCVCVVRAWGVCVSGCGVCVCVALEYKRESHNIVVYLKTQFVPRSKHTLSRL
jgi:cytidine deaminase